MERFLGLSQEALKENQKLWHEERTEPEDSDSAASGSDLRSIGISSGDIEGDEEVADEIENMDQMGGEQGMEQIAPVGGPEAGGMPPPAPPM